MTHHSTDERPTAGSNTDRLLTFNDTLKVLGMSRSSAYRLLSQNALPRPIKIGALNFFSEREIQAWIADHLAKRDQGGEHV